MTLVAHGWSDEWIAATVQVQRKTLNSPQNLGMTEWIAATVQVQRKTLNSPQNLGVTANDSQIFTMDLDKMQPAPNYKQSAARIHAMCAASRVLKRSSNLCDIHTNVVVKAILERSTLSSRMSGGHVVRVSWECEILHAS